METLDPTDYRVWLRFCDLPPYAEREGKKSKFLHTFCFCRWRESNLGCQRSMRVGYPLLCLRKVDYSKYDQ